MKNIFPLLIVGGILLMGGGAVASYANHKVRGIRNNNPGNIELKSTKWVGMSPKQTDGRYIQFTDAIYGIRALYKTLLTYRNNYGLKTITGIITRWAPPNENDTAAYISFVSKKTGIAANTPINSASNYLKVIKAIITQENGVMPYTEAELKKGMALATA